MTILCRGDSLLGPANALGTRRVARLASRSPMVGSINAPEPGFRPGVRWELGSPEHGRQRTHQVFVPARAGALARWGSGVRWGFWHALAGSGVLGGPGMRWGPGARWRALALAGALARVGGSAFPGD